MRHLGDVVRTLREGRNLGLRELARAAAVDPGSLSKLERHKQHQLTPDYLARVAQALDEAGRAKGLEPVTVASIREAVGDTDEERPPPDHWPTFEEIVAADEELSDRQRAALIATYRAFVPRRR